MTEVLSVRAKKSLKDEAEKKLKVQKVAAELSSRMDVKDEEWVKDVKSTRREMHLNESKIQIILRPQPRYFLFF